VEADCYLLTLILTYWGPKSQNASNVTDISDTLRVGLASNCNDFQQTSSKLGWMFSAKNLINDTVWTLQRLGIEPRTSRSSSTWPA
jgi:hypothetical protein